MKNVTAFGVLIFAIANEGLSSEADTNRLSARRSVTVVYRASREQVDSAVRGHATNLWRIEIKPETGQAMTQEWKSEASDIPSENEARSRLCSGEVKFFWMPPEVAVRKVSEGGRIVPLRSPIWIATGSLKTNNGVAFVTLSRDLEQGITLHIPYTEIPAGRGRSSATGVYRTDMEWLRSLLGTNVPIAEFIGKKYFDPEVVHALETGTNNPTGK